MVMFKTNELNTGGLKENSNSFSLSKFNANVAIGTSIKELEASIGMPEENKVISFVTNGAWSMHQLLCYLVQKTGPASVYVSTWRMGEKPLRTIAGLKSIGLIKEFNLIISDRMKSHNPDEHQFALTVCDRMVFTKNHSKVTVIRGDLFTATIIGTANYSTNRRIEAGTIFYDWKISAFHKNWMSNVLNGKAINESD